MRYLFTAVTEGWDELEAPGAVPDGWRCVCFTDRELEHPGWEMRPIPGKAAVPVRAARQVKLLAHESLPDAEISLWIDGNMSVLCDLDLLVEEYLEGVDLALHRHPERHCLYEEAAACARKGKDDPAIVLHQVVGYAIDGLPRRAGLFATGAVLRRHTSQVADFNRRWWDEVRRGSHRDQLAFPAALRATGIGYALFDSDVREGPLFRWRPHERGPAGAHGSLGATAPS